MIRRLFFFFYVAVLFLRKILIFRDDRVGVWLIGENRGECLKENGYWFYVYCRENHPHSTVYFVIKDYSPFYDDEMVFDPRVIVFGSAHHARVFVESTIILYTHTFKDVVYRRVFEIFGARKKKVFLHHGVLGFKRFNKYYRQNKNSMDIFTVGSSLEKKILVGDESVDEWRVKVLGYARYDTMYNRAKKNENFQIIYIPTHRNNIIGEFTESRYYAATKSLLNSKKLDDVLSKYRVKIKFYLHKEFQIYSDLYASDSKNIEIVKLGEETPKDLIMESHLMITDYSSVSWDFFFLGKPVIFYRFDIDDYIGDRDSYVDLYDDRVGEIFTSESDLLEAVESYAKTGFMMKERNMQYRRETIPNLDTLNCYRIFREVDKLHYYVAEHA